MSARVIVTGLERKIELAAQGGRIVRAGMKCERVDGFDSNRVLMKELAIRCDLAVDFAAYEAGIRNV